MLIHISNFFDKDFRGMYHAGVWFLGFMCLSISIPGHKMDGDTAWRTSNELVHDHSALAGEGMPLQSTDLQDEQAIDASSHGKLEDGGRSASVRPDEREEIEIQQLDASITGWLSELVLIIDVVQDLLGHVTVDSPHLCKRQVDDIGVVLCSPVYCLFERTSQICIALLSIAALHGLRCSHLIPQLCELILKLLWRATFLTSLITYLICVFLMITSESFTQCTASYQS